MLAWPVAAARQERAIRSYSGVDRRRGDCGSQRQRGRRRGDEASARACARPLHSGGSLPSDSERARCAGASPEIFCCLYATAAFVSAEDLVGSGATMCGPPGADFVMGVCEYDLPPLLALKIGDGDRRANVAGISSSAIAGLSAACLQQRHFLLGAHEAFPHNAILLWPAAARLCAAARRAP